MVDQLQENSKNLVDVAKEALRQNSRLKKVIILKRISRCDRRSSNLIGIQSELSKYGNSVYDQLWTN